MPTVSVILPTYNRADILPRAIESVLSQNYDDFELVIIDDGSTDETYNVVSKFDSEKITYIYQKNRGANAARNVGISVSQGEFISFLDSDDIFKENKLNKVVSKFRSCPTDCGAVFHSYIVKKNRVVVNMSILKNKIVTFNDLQEQNMIGSFSCFTVKKSVFEDVGYLDDDLESSQDYEFYLRMSKKYDIYGIKPVLVHKYLFGDQITNNAEKKITGLEQLSERHDLGKRRLATHARIKAIIYIEHKKYEMAEDSLRRCYNYGSMKCKALLILLLISPHLCVFVVRLFTLIRRIQVKIKYHIWVKKW